MTNVLRYGVAIGLVAGSAIITRHLFPGLLVLGDTGRLEQVFWN